MNMRTTKNVRFGIAGVILLAMAVSAPAALWEGNIRDGYAGSDPMPHAGVWSYQYVAKVDLADPSLYMNMVWNTDMNPDRWASSATGNAPASVYYQEAQGRLDMQGTATIASIIRWTSPVTGEADITWVGTSSLTFDDVDFQVLDNTGSILWSQTVGHGASFSTGTIEQNVTQGQHVFFIAHSTTSTSAGAMMWAGQGIEISVVPEPATAGLLIAAMMGLLAVAARRTKRRSEA